MADQLPIRYYKPRADFKFDITDIQNFVYDMSRCQVLPHRTVTPFAL